MAKNKKRGRGATPQSSGSAETEATARAEGATHETAHAAGVQGATGSGSAAPGDRFDPFTSPRARLWANVFIGLFLAYQVAMPLRYYAGGRGLDERFSWRMFSSVRMLECNVDIDEHVEEFGDVHQRDVSLKKEVQVAWIGLLERGRDLVIEKFLRRRCDEEGVVKVDYYLGCVAPDGAKWPPVRRHMKCSDRKLADGPGKL
jgi:hypothetical protein